MTLGLAACGKLQAGYYLTPENYPTPRPTDPSTAAMDTPAAPTATPPSTVQSIETATLTPLPTPTSSPSSTPSPVPCTETEGQIVVDTFISHMTGRDFRYRIYLPPCYAQSGRSYPYVIMLHGLVPGTDAMDDSQWIRLGMTGAADQGFVAGDLPPLIIVMPNGNDADYGYDNSTLPDIIVNELMPLVESRYCIWNEPAYRAIGGLSRGGFWAYWIAFSHPELFGRVGGHSPFFYTADYASDENPDNLVDTAPGINSLVMHIDHGAQDYVENGAVDFVTRLQRRGIDPEYIVYPTGAHTEDYWASHVADYLDFYTADWPRSVQDYPVCSQPGAGIPAP